MQQAFFSHDVSQILALRGMDTVGRFSAMLDNETILRLPVCLPIHQTFLKIEQL